MSFTAISVEMFFSPNFFVIPLIVSPGCTLYVWNVTGWENTVCNGTEGSSPTRVPSAVYSCVSSSANDDIIALSFSMSSALLWSRLSGEERRGEKSMCFAAKTAADAVTKAATAAIRIVLRFFAMKLYAAAE